MKMKFIISGILIVAIGLVLSHTYRPYVYENHINDYHLADVIGSIVCVPAAVLCVYGIDNRYSIKQYTIGAAVSLYCIRVSRSFSYTWHLRCI